MAQALFVYVGGAAKQNYLHGLESGLWGFTHSRAEYEDVKPGMRVIFGHALNPGGPRSALERFRAGRLSSLVVGRVTSPVYSAIEPHWPDEHESQTVRYGWRFSFEIEGEATNVRLQPFSSEFVETLRHSGTQYSQGEVVDLSQEDLEELDLLPLRPYGAFPLRPGDRVTRAQLDAQFGGGIQGGMLTPAGERYMFLFSDPIPGRLYGYEFDGWADESHTVYYYTGEGTDGPQQATRKNAALLASVEDGREVHLFIAVGTAPDSEARVHEYAGQFALDRHQPFRSEDGPDAAGEMRSVFVFTLARVSTTNVDDVSAVKTIAAQVAESNSAKIISREAANVAEFERPASSASIGRRRERALEAQLIEWLENRGKDVSRLEILIKGQSGRLLTDSWVDSDRELFEVKGDSTRENVRMAVGQLLDYARHIDPPASTLTVVLPKDPGEDLVDLAASVGLTIAVFANGELTRL